MSSIELEYDFSHLRESKARRDAEIVAKGAEHGAEWAQKHAEYDLLKHIAEEVSEGNYEAATEALKSFHEARGGSDFFLIEVFGDLYDQFRGYPPEAYFDSFVEAAAKVFDAFEAAEG
ncbi:MAG TPA: hypothetical protein PJ986_14090 [Gammaproteobacteria bacterium]|nr:hypothetical protein [Gammaproteobacteria bacterium]